MKYTPIVLLILAFTSCRPTGEQATSSANGYPIQPVPIRNVQLTDEFWLPVIKRVQDQTLQYALEKCREEGRMDNFLIAGGQLEGTTLGRMPFDDTDLYKIIEGASYSLVSSPDPELDAYLDSLITIIAIGQEADGYLTTWRTIDGMHPPAPWVNPGKRWEHLAASHELYNSGHMFEAAAAHFDATGKRNFLDIALKNADLLVKTFGPGKLELLPGHQVVETGLIKLYQISGKDDYLNLARYFLDQRGDSTTHELYGPYSQDHLPVTQQKEVVGHAVRAVYMYAGMTDIAAIQKDTAYFQASQNLWENMVRKKMYITGGIGARHEGESFGANYELPNKTAYSETCAAIGSVYWNHRMFLLTGEVKYYDVIERTLYNGLLSGLSLDGKKFFYPNALESDGKYTFNQGACTRKDWFDCSCCPTNLIRFLPAVPGLINAVRRDTLYVNLFASNQAEMTLRGKKVTVIQNTNYPWNGLVTLTLEPTQPEEFTVMLRVPGWSRNEVLPGDLYSYANPAPEEGPAIRVNGELTKTIVQDGYYTLKQKWHAGDEIQMILPMNLRQVQTNEKVAENQGKQALEYGPIVYCVEDADNPSGVESITLGAIDTWQVTKKPELLEGVNVLSVGPSDDPDFTAIPYYAWSNRGVGAMKVWLPVEK